MNNDRGNRKPPMDRDGPRDRSGPRDKASPRAERSRPAVTAEDNDGSERIAKRLARAGIASRRDAEMMIVAGRIAVNGKVLESPAFNVMRDDTITVDGKPLPPIERTRLWLYHKQAGLVTTNRDPEGRPTVFDSLPEGMPRVLSVGRLDINTEGLLLLTNDGGLARVLELPSTGWVRKYRVRAHGKVKQSDLDQLKNGIAIDGIFYGAVDASIEREQGSNVWLSVALREGKNREVKNILGELGLSVTRLIRVSFGPFQLADLEEGAVRELKGRILREQLGERLIEEANADFESPILKPFSNAPVVGETRLSERPQVSEDGWISSTAAAAARGGGRGKKGDFAERGRARLSTKPDDRPRDRGNDRFADRSKGRDKDTDDKPEQQAPRSRSANVWMAPGARPQTARKKVWRDDEGRRERHATDGDNRPVRAREDRAYGDKPKQYGDRPREDKREGGYEKRDRPNYGDKPRQFGDKPKQYGDKPKQYGDRQERGERKPYGARDTRSTASDAPRERSYGDRSRDDKREGGYEKRDRPSYGDKPRQFGDKPKQYGDRPKQYGDRQERGERKPYGARDTRSTASDAPRERSYGDRSRDDKREGGYEKRDRPSYGDKPRQFGDKPKQYGDRPKQYGDRQERGERKPYGARDTRSSASDAPRERSYGDRSRDDKRDGGYEKRDRKPLSDTSGKSRDGGYAKKSAGGASYAGKGKPGGAARPSTGVRKDRPAGGPRADRRR
ncbi:pseudouridine synthase [Bartonella sp. LJL80]